MSQYFYQTIGFWADCIVIGYAIGYAGAALVSWVREHANR